jgi:amino acid transporter
MGLTSAEMEHYNTNIIYAIADKLYGENFAILAILAVLLSTIGTIETSIIQFSRVLFAKSRDGMAHKMFSRIHDKWLTPHYAIVTIWILGLVFIFLSSFVDSINKLLSILVLSIGVQFSFYASLTALASAWHFRRHCKDGFVMLLTRIIFPLLAGIALIASIIYVSLESDWMTNAVGIGGILIGLIPYYLYSRKTVAIKAYANL